ncbi:MAG TPA: hypothetical protein VGC72_11030 [Candidatus Elarobacter sp.]|jgi:hypothetical protein
MPADPQNTQMEQPLLALVERLNAQFIPDLNGKLNDHSIDHIAAVDAALAQTHDVERQLASIQATANQLGANPTGPLAQRVFDMTSAVRRARATLEAERKAALDIKAAVPPPPSYPTTAEEVLKQMRESTAPGQMMFNIEKAAIEARRKSIDDISARIHDTYKKF